MQHLEVKRCGTTTIGVVRRQKVKSPPQDTTAPQSHVLYLEYLVYCS